VSASCSVGTQLAAWLGLPTFEFAIIQVLPENEIPFQKGDQAQPGPAFITRLEPGMSVTFNAALAHAPRDGGCFIFWHEHRVRI